MPITFPPVWFALEPPPHLLVVSPRTEIASLRQDLLLQTMDLATMEDIERQVEALDLSALVTRIGGLGATYPAIVSDDSSLRYTIETVAEECAPVPDLYAARLALCAAPAEYPARL